MAFSRTDSTCGCVSGPATINALPVHTMSIQPPGTTTSFFPDRRSLFPQARRSQGRSGSVGRRSQYKPATFGKQRVSFSPGAGPAELPVESIDRWPIYSRLPTDVHCNTRGCFVTAKGAMWFAQLQKATKETVRDEQANVNADHHALDLHYSYT